VRSVLEDVGLLRENFRGKRLPAGAGILIGAAAALGGLAGRIVLRRHLPVLTASPIAGSRTAVVASAFVTGGLLAFVAGCVGLVDDASSDKSVKGLGGHLKEFREGRLTTGAVKAVFGGSAATALAVLLYLQSRGAGSVRPVWMVPADVLVLALSMNAFNLFDLRPGRALKVWLPITAALWYAAWSAAPSSVRLVYTQPELVAGFVVALLIFPFDLRERVMLGDAGTMAMGALVGWSIIATMGTWIRLVALALLVALHIATERISLSALIDSIAPLRWLDRLGRPPETRATALKAKKAPARP
jgi:UDP-GlcNAc:undecaprenyl-phosphate/decaprenyl-phosphate GlcNAc-1-phosphate transferase